jgi:hypothetical protein
MKGIPFLREEITVYDARTLSPEKFNEYMEQGFNKKIPIIHTIYYHTNFPKRIELVNNLDHNPYHLLFYMIAPFYYFDDGSRPIEYFYPEHSRYLSNEALNLLPSRFHRQTEKQQRTEYIQMPGCRWNIDWINETWIYDYVKDLYKPLWENTKQERGKYVYICRSKRNHTQRAILNEDSLLPVLKGLGVSCYALEDMTFTDTVRLFKSAELVIGSHGAGLAWLIFSDPGTTVLEIYKNKLLKEHYTYLCSSCKLKSFRFTGVKDDPNVPPPTDPKEVDDGHMIVDIAGMEHAVRQLSKDIESAYTDGRNPISS